MYSANLRIENSNNSDMQHLWTKSRKDKDKQFLEYFLKY